MVITYVILSLVLSRFFDASGIALATTVASFLQSLFLLYFLWKQSKPEKSIIIELVLDICKYTVAFAVVYFVSRPFYLMVNNYPNLITLVIVTVIVFSLFLMLSFLLKIKETRVLLRFLKKE